MNQRTYYSEEARMREQRNMGLLAIFALAIGVGVGTVLALLFAPGEGEETREDLSHMMEKRVGTVEKQVNDLRKRLEERIANLT